MTVSHTWQQDKGTRWWDCVKCGERSAYSRTLRRYVYKDREFNDSCVTYYDTWEEMEEGKL
jgi:hypothetical protein